jgi:branched-chain amino acid transport system substrate-binding protein
VKYFGLCLILAISGILLSSCASGVSSYHCMDTLGCVVISATDNLKIATLLTMTGPDKVYGIDAVRGVEIAITDSGKLLGHNLELVKADDQCDARAGQAAAMQLASDKQIIGVIGATCSSATEPAAKLLTDAGMVLISPSSTAPSLTELATHQTGFFRAIYNDKAQGKAVADFAFNVLGTHRMATVHDGTAYPKQLQQAACDSFQQLGGKCVDQIDLSTGVDILTALQAAAGLNPDVIYFPLNSVDGIAVTKDISLAGLTKAALISSDSLLSPEFIQKTQPNSDGMYLSGPASVLESQTFTDKYKARYGENPIAPYHLQAYDSANMLFMAIQQAALTVGDTIYIQRQVLRDALYKLHGFQGLSAQISCSANGDCVHPNIEIFQVVNNDFKPIYP